jgi:IclR family pca regulon transcriptional regulator
VLLADLEPRELDRVLRTPSRSDIVPRAKLVRRTLDASLKQVRSRGWALSDEQLSFGIRSIAAPVRNADGSVVAAVNVTVNAAETSIAELKRAYLPKLLATAEAISRDFARLATLPRSTRRTKS